MKKISTVKISTRKTSLFILSIIVFSIFLNIFNTPFVLGDSLRIENQQWDFISNNPLTIIVSGEKENLKFKLSNFQICIKNYQEKGYSLHIAISRCKYLRSNREVQENNSNHSEDGKENDFEFCLKEYQKEGYSSKISNARCKYLR